MNNFKDNIEIINNYKHLKNTISSFFHITDGLINKYSKGNNNMEKQNNNNILIKKVKISDSISNNEDLEIKKIEKHFHEIEELLNKSPNMIDRKESDTNPNNNNSNNDKLSQKIYELTKENKMLREKIEQLIDILNSKRENEANEENQRQNDREENKKKRK